MKRVPGIKLLLLIPFIFAGLNFAALSGSLYFLRPAPGQMAGFYFWSAAMVALTLLVSGLITWQLFRPMRRFARQAGSLPLPAAPAAADELEAFSRLFEQVSGILSSLEADRFFPDLVGRSRLMRGVMSQMLKVAPTATTVLICGETGTGKELAARGVYRQSDRRDRPFVVINCAAVPPGLLESELFGHEKGAFTGATARRPGKFEEADGGTIFLDEIGELPLETQSRLLRVLQERVIERVGGNRPLPVDVRVIAATNRDLEEMVKQGRFRDDLYYRLNVFTITLPPLRLRREDIPLLTEHFLAEHGKSTEVAPAAMTMLTAYHWPGNVRELLNVLERAVLLADDQPIAPEHLPPSLPKPTLFQTAGPEPAAAEHDAHRQANTAPDIPDTAIAPALTPGPPAANFDPEPPPDIPLDERLQFIERQLLLDALQRSDGIQVKAAALLGIKERSLHHRLRKYGIDAMALRKNRRE